MHRLDWGTDVCYNMSMRVYTILLVLSLQGCAYTAVSTGTYVLTGKSIMDHAATAATGNRCDATSLVLGKQDWYCERPREPGTTYNRHEF
jgi:hypothetical protein